MKTENDSSLPTQEDRRRQLFELTQARYADRGVTLDDPIYLALIEQWIVGTITMREALEQWQAARASQLSNPAAHTPADEYDYPSMSTAELLAEIETAIDDWSVSDPVDKSVDR